MRTLYDIQGTKIYAESVEEASHLYLEQDEKKQVEVDDNFVDFSLEQIYQEVARIRAIYPAYRQNSRHKWVQVILEEIGEIAHSLNDNEQKPNGETMHDLYTEIIQTCAGLLHLAIAERNSGSIKLDLVEEEAIAEATVPLDEPLPPVIEPETKDDLMAEAVAEFVEEMGREPEITTNDEPLVEVETIPELETTVLAEVPCVMPTETTQDIVCPNNAVECPQESPVAEQGQGVTTEETPPTTPVEPVKTVVAEPTVEATPKNRMIVGIDPATNQPIYATF